MPIKNGSDTFTLSSKLDLYFKCYPHFSHTSLYYDTSFKESSYVEASSSVGVSTTASGQSANNVSS